MRELLVVVVACHLASGTIAAQELRDGKTERTTNANRDLVLELFHGRGTSIVIDSGGAHFCGPYDGVKFRLGHPRDEPEWRADFVTEFTVSKPGEVFWWPGKHGSVIFSVKEISHGKLILRYEASFFDGDDSGEITLVPFHIE